MVWPAFRRMAAGCGPLANLPLLHQPCALVPSWLTLRGAVLSLIPLEIGPLAQLAWLKGRRHMQGLRALAAGALD